MRLYPQWLLLALAWGLSSISISIWPRVNSLDLGLKADLMTFLLFKPFHYLTSFFLLLFVLLILFEVKRKIIFEYKVALLLRVLPYESLLLGAYVIFIYWKVLRFYPLLGTALFLLLTLYYFIEYVYERKKKVTYVKEN